MDDDELLPHHEHPELVQRLRAFGNAPLEPGISERWHHRLRGDDRPARRGFSSKWLVAATLAGFAAGSVGLAAAAVLPAPVQDVAHTTLDHVGVHVPPGHDRYNDPGVCPGGPYANHGAYVRSHKNDPAAGKSPCGKPVKSVTPGKSTAGNDDKADDSKGAHGPPPWAHGKGPHGKKNKSAKPPKSADDGEPATTRPPATSSTSTSSTPSTSSSTSSSTTTTSRP